VKIAVGENEAQASRCAAFIAANGSGVVLICAACARGFEIAT